MENQQIEAAFVHILNYTTAAIVQLVTCLENAGALEKGRYAAAIADTINRQGAERNRPDYQHLALLLRYLQGDFEIKPPTLQVIEGGKGPENSEK
jgi:hypothetical protein